jgi:hypothetical protein
MYGAATGRLKTRRNTETLQMMNKSQMGLRTKIVLFIGLRGGESKLMIMGRCLGFGWSVGCQRSTPSRSERLTAGTRCEK